MQKYNSIKSHKNSVCNPFRYLDLWDLEKLSKQSDEMESETKALVLEAVMEKRADVADDQFKDLIGQGHLV